MLSLWVAWMASATCGNRRNSAHCPGSSRPQVPSILRSEHTPQIRLRTNPSSSANVLSMSDPSWDIHTTARRSPTRRFCNYCVLWRFASAWGICGDIRADPAGFLGEIPRPDAAVCGWGTRRAAAIIANRTVPGGSSGEISGTIPASQAREKFAGSLRVSRTTRSGCGSGSGLWLRQTHPSPARTFRPASACRHAERTRARCGPVRRAGPLHKRVHYRELNRLHYARSGRGPRLFLRVTFQGLVLFVVLSGFRQFLRPRLGIQVAIRARFLGGLNVLRLGEGQCRDSQKTCCQDGGWNGVFNPHHKTSVPVFCNWIATQH